MEILKKVVIGVLISVCAYLVKDYLFYGGIMPVNAATINDTTYRTRNLTGGTNDKNDFINSGTTFLGLYYDFNDFTISDDEDTVIFSYSINFFNNSGQTFDINERVTLVVDYTQNGTTYSDVTYFGTAQDGYAVFTHLPLGAKIKRFNIAAEPVPSCVGGSCSQSYSVGYRVHVNETCMTLLSDSTLLFEIFSNTLPINSIKSIVSNILTAINSQANNSTSTSEENTATDFTADTTSSSQASSLESELTAGSDNHINSINSMDVGLDSNASSFIWSIIERLKNTNAKVSCFFISILSVSIIKLVLGR